MMPASIDQEIEAIEPGVRSCRRAQRAWARQPVVERLRFARALRHLIAENAQELAAAAAAVSERPVAEKLVAEVLPLAEACRWLERRAAPVLRSRRCGRSGGPFWLRGVSFEVQRQPFGTVLVIGPQNYPLFLPAVQALHALVAGNAVLLKPAPGTRGVAMAWAELASSAGLDPRLLTILPESVDSAREAIDRGVDKVIFTGSSANGRRVLGQLARSNTPAVMELSGDDAVVVLADADLDLVVRALQFGTHLNSGETCIAPRRLVVADSIVEALLSRLRRVDVPALPFTRFLDDEGALQLVEMASFGLGVSIFSRDLARARSLAGRVKSGFVLINDLIVPTADPRMPFGGIKASGFGVTRGDEGLLEMTFPHVVAVRRSKSYPHLDEPHPGDARLFSSYIRAAHGRGKQRLGALLELVRSIIRRTAKP